jgi:hypothetical protein
VKKMATIHVFSILMKRLRSITKIKSALITSGSMKKPLENAKIFRGKISICLLVDPFEYEFSSPYFQCLSEKSMYRFQSYSVRSCFPSRRW